MAAVIQAHGENLGPRSAAVGQVPTLPPPVPAPNQAQLRPGDQSRVLQQLKAEAEALSRMHRDLHHGRMDEGSTSPAVESLASQKPVAREKPPRTGAMSAAMMRQAPGGHGTQSWEPGFPTPQLVSSDNKEPGRGELDRLQTERRQLVEWGENLYKEVTRLEREKERLESQVRDEQVQRQQAESARDRISQRSQELERRLSDSHGQETSASALESENKELRKQLSAYAVEIDALRTEKEGVLDTVTDLQETVQRVTVERDNYLLTVEDLERSYQEMQTKYTQLGNLMDVEIEKKKSFEERLREAQAELDVVGASLKLARETGSRHKADLDQQEQLLRERDEQLQNLTDVIRPLQDMYTQLQDGFVAQTREYHYFLGQVMEKQRNAQNGLDVTSRQIEAVEASVMNLRPELMRAKDEALERSLDLQRRFEEEKAGFADTQAQWQQRQREWEEERNQHYQNSSLLQTRLQEERKVAEQAKKTLEEQQRLKQKRQSVKQRYSVSNVNLMRELSMIQEGKVLEKVNDRNLKRERRFVTVDTQENCMRWGKDPQGRTTTSMLELSDVIHIDYGRTARAFVLEPNSDVRPWLCFSLYTPRRSFDFVCPDEDTVRAFVLGVSRLCDSASGAIATRSRFTFSKLICKIDYRVYKQRQQAMTPEERRKISRAHIIREAIDTAARQLGASQQSQPQRGARPLAVHQGPASSMPKRSPAPSVGPSGGSRTPPGGGGSRTPPGTPPGSPRNTGGYTALRPR